MARFRQHTTPSRFCICPQRGNLLSCWQPSPGILEIDGWKHPLVMLKLPYSFGDTIVKIDHQPNQHYLKVFLWLFWEAKTWDNFLFTQVYWKLDPICLLFAFHIQWAVWTSYICPLPTRRGESQGLA